MVRAGDYREKVRIEVRTSTQNSEGEPYNTWTTLATVRCAIQRQTGREVFDAHQREGRVPTIFRIRYSSQVSSMTPAMRLVLLSNNAVYDIISVVDQGGRREELLITAEEHVGETAGEDGGPYVPPVVRLDADKVTVAAIEGLSATDAQAALAEHQSALATLQAADTTLQGNLDAEAASRADADDLLDGRVGANEADIASLLTQIAEAVLKSGAQDIDGVKTFLAQAVLQAGAALGAKLTISGVAAGDAAIELEDGNLLGKHDSSALGASNRRWVNVWATGVNANLFRDLTGQNRFIFGGGGPNDYLARSGTGTASPFAHRFAVSNGPMTNAAAMLAGFYLDNLLTLRAQITKDGAFENPTAGANFAIAKSPNGTRYGVSVANDGTLVTTPL